MASRRRGGKAIPVDYEKIVVFVRIPVVPEEKLSKLQDYIRKAVSKARGRATMMGATRENVGGKCLSVTPQDVLGGSMLA